MPELIPPHVALTLGALALAAGVTLFGHGLAALGDMLAEPEAEPLPSTPPGPVLHLDERDVCQVLLAGGWVRVELCGTGPLMPRGDVWVCSPTEFGRRYRAGEGRLTRHLGELVDPAVAVPS